MSEPAISQRGVSVCEQPLVHVELSLSMVYEVLVRRRQRNKTQSQFWMPLGYAPIINRVVT
ncbi:hypothetical protein NEUTE1DRAFT_119289 [Neurospora tetrasperma FGSC 2508]|uniref:Uncharacterized protein n=1 Tax=Neurospora tetrasperma (strain FGSC 2508 / ATCC MYA-4615 / P0657) TaxID=510951 RepID=F8MZM9_NEUT8|nr:uncharacterized protein NEUTE1DRAFT_119289 [Neurospora tetrasperma FGSC 2508]EGO53719.1 hypothetical protein NEUTE1DRAFT_119289 [Neurospora tetrasperma FGSC 2508]EGZ76204.1 hypothetical protein NEUTE2DRAFT_142422 [Neurospora tetrasperma FGSC 2509]